MAYSEFRIPEYDDQMVILNINGEPLYQLEYKSLLREILVRNDVATLDCYIKQNPLAALAPGELPHHDPFYVAAEHGSTDALRMLLDLYEADPSQAAHAINEDGRRFSLLNAACLGGRLETVRFLLDRDPPLGAAYAGDRDGGQALVFAGKSLIEPSFLINEEIQDNDSKRCFHQCIAQSDDVLRLLLDRGASARNAIFIH